MRELRKSSQRSQKKHRQRHAYNEVKFKILALLQPSMRYYAPEEIASELGLTPGSVRTRLSKLCELGYIWRKKEYRIRKNQFCYGRLKHKGIRVLIGTNWYTGLTKRMEMRHVTGEKISLNLRKAPTEEQKRKYERLLPYANRPTKAGK